MPQHRLTFVPVMFALVLAAASCAASTGAARAADECIAEPNTPAPQGEHWYYRTDRATKRQCWHLGPQGANVQKSATEASKQPASDALALPAAPRRAQGPTATAPMAAPAATATEANVPTPTAPLRWPEAAKLPDVPPSFEPAPQPALVEAPRSGDVIDSAPAPASNRAEAAVEADHTFALIVITLAPLAIAGLVFHAARWSRRRTASVRQGLGRPRPSTLNTSYPHARTSLDSGSETSTRHIPPLPKPLDQTEKLAQALQQLLNDMQTKQYAPRSGPSIVTRSSQPPSGLHHDQTAHHEV